MSNLQRAYWSLLYVGLVFAVFTVAAAIGAFCAFVAILIGGS